MFTSLICFASIGKHVQKIDPEVECLKNLTSVSLLFERTNSEAGIPSDQDLSDFVEVELLSKGIPVKSSADASAAIKESLRTNKPLLVATLYVVVTGMKLDVGTGYPFHIQLELYLPAFHLPHNDQAASNYLLMQSGVIGFTGSKDEEYVRQSLLGVVQKFELSWLRAHPPKDTLIIFNPLPNRHLGQH